MQILEISGVREGDNIFRVDLHKAKLALDQVPQIERVEIRRILPDRVDIRVSERQPVAWVAASASVRLGVGTDSFLVDSRGYVMRPRKVLPEHLALPLITGVVMEDVAPGQKLPSAEAVAAVELIRLSAEDLKWQPRVVDISKGYCLSVVDNRKARITFGFDALEDQLAKLRQLIELVEPTQKEFVSVNLMLEKSVPVVFAAPPPVAAPMDPKNGKAKAAHAKATHGGVVPKTFSEPIAFVDPVVGVSSPAAPPVPGDAIGSVSGGIVELGEQTRGRQSFLEAPKGGTVIAAEVAADRGGKASPKAGTVNAKLSPSFERVRSGASDENAAVNRARVDGKNSGLNSGVRIPAVAAASAGNASIAGVSKEPVSKTMYQKNVKTKTVRVPVRVRRVSEMKATGAGRDVPAVEPRAVRGVGPVLKGTPPSTVRPSLNPSEALRKLFSPHG
jgi:hypothetical protein